MKAYSPIQIMQILGRPKILLMLLLSSIISSQAIACEYHVAQAQSVWIGIMERFGDEAEADKAREAFNKAHPHNQITATKPAIKKSGSSQTKDNSSLVEDVQGWMSRVKR